MTITQTLKSDDGEENQSHDRGPVGGVTRPGAGGWRHTTGGRWVASHDRGAVGGVTRPGAGGWRHTIDRGPVGGITRPGDGGWRHTTGGRWVASHDRGPVGGVTRPGDGGWRHTTGGRWVASHDRGPVGGVTRPGDGGWRHTTGGRWVASHDRGTVGGVTRPGAGGWRHTTRCHTPGVTGWASPDRRAGGCVTSDRGPWFGVTRAVALWVASHDRGPLGGPSQLPGDGGFMSHYRGLGWPSHYPGSHDQDSGCVTRPGMWCVTLPWGRGWRHTTRGHNDQDKWVASHDDGDWVRHTTGGPLGASTTEGRLVVSPP